jgi:ATP-binding cassette, subfamily B, bacterial
MSASGSDTKMRTMPAQTQFEKPLADSSSLGGAPPQTNHGAWSDRVAALKNIPPVLHFVWESGPAVVFWNIAIRIVVAFLPVGIGIIVRYIIDGVNRIRFHQPLPMHVFWWLVAAEMGLAVLMGVLSRAVDYFDNLLADRYTHHVSVEVMRKAAALDVTVYEDPVFYDRLERARVQATDRLAMIQQMGRLIQQSVTAIAFSAVLIFYSPFLLLPAHCRNRSCISGREPLRLSHLCQELPADADSSPDGLPAPGRRQQGSSQGAQALQPERYLTGSLHRAFAKDLRRECEPESPPAVLGRPAFDPRPGWLLRSLRLQHFAHHSGHYSIGDLTLITAAIMQAMSNIQQAFSTASGVADQALFLTDLLAFFAMEAAREIEALNGLSDAAPIMLGFEFQQRVLCLSGDKSPRSRPTSISRSARISAWP